MSDLTQVRVAIRTFFAVTRDNLQAIKEGDLEKWLDTRGRGSETMEAVRDSVESLVADLRSQVSPESLSFMETFMTKVVAGMPGGDLQDPQETLFALICHAAIDLPEANARVLLTYLEHRGQDGLAKNVRRVRALIRRRIEILKKREPNDFDRLTQGMEEQTIVKIKIIHGLVSALEKELDV